MKLDKRKLSHDILNLLERLRIMHDLARDQNFAAISKDELKQDLLDTLEQLKKDFDTIIES